MPVFAVQELDLAAWDYNISLDFASFALLTIIE